MSLHNDTIHLNHMTEYKNSFSTWKSSPEQINEYTDYIDLDKAGN